MKVTKIPKGNGKYRTIYVPSKEEKLILSRYKRLLEDCLIARECAGVIHGFRTGRSPVTNAMQHVGFKYTLSMDLQDFFDTVTPAMFPELSPFALFVPYHADFYREYHINPKTFEGMVKSNHELGMGHQGLVTRFVAVLDTAPGNAVLYYAGRMRTLEWSNYLTGGVMPHAWLIGESPGNETLVPFFPDGAARQGLPTSPMIANIAACPMDHKIRGAADSLGNIAYTRYADDLCFSFDDYAIYEPLMRYVRELVDQSGFVINERKTRLQFASTGRRIVTGVGVGQDGIYPTRRLRRRHRAALHQHHWPQANGLGEVMKNVVPKEWLKEEDLCNALWDKVWGKYEDAVQ